MTNYYNMGQRKILMRIKMFLVKLLKTRYHSGNHLPDEPSTSVRAEVSSPGRREPDEISPGLSEPSTRRW